MKHSKLVVRPISNDTVRELVTTLAQRVGRKDYNPDPLLDRLDSPIHHNLRGRVGRALRHTINGLTNEISPSSQTVQRAANLLDGVHMSDALISLSRAQHKRNAHSQDSSALTPNSSD
ncbi:hypothetical protein HY990_06835 [Candidatus Micrarchaeota archaeon]|nr:hypothetical protein [Candidatus Micrarchaeota archaeon]